MPTRTMGFESPVPGRSVRCPPGSAAQLHDESQLIPDELRAHEKDDPRLTGDHDMLPPSNASLAAEVAGRDERVAAMKLVHVGDHGFATEGAPPGAAFSERGSALYEA